MGEMDGVMSVVVKVLQAGPLVIVAAVLAASYFRLWLWRADHNEALNAQENGHAKIEALLTKRIEELIEERDRLRGWVDDIVPPLTNTLRQKRGERA